MKLSSLTIVVPAYDEALAIGETLEVILGGLPPSIAACEVLVVDDGSRDGTAEVVRGMALGDERIRCVSHGRNGGKGRALRTGFTEARKDWVLFLDADQQVQTDGLLRVAGLAEDVEAVVGYRVKRHDTPKRRLITALFGVLVGATLGVRARDVNCPFKLFRRDLIQSLNLRSNGFLIDAEILYRLSRREIAVEEVPVAWHPRRHGRSTIRWRHLVQLVRELATLLVERGRAAAGADSS
jgi:glycosyltransferase involved in cell wall biosynthesis